MKILVLGANGMIGHRVILELRKYFGDQVYGLIRRSRSDFNTTEMLQTNIFEKIDIVNWNDFSRLLSDLSPNIVINAIGVTIRRPEIQDLSYALEVNSFFPQRLAKWAQYNNSKLIHFSTDCIFSGESGNYTELSNPSASDVYGRTKFLGEVDGPNCLTLRFSCIGQELDTRSELLEWFLSQDNSSIKGFTNVLYSGVSSIVVSKEVCRIIQEYKSLTGIYQISSFPISKYDLLNLAKKHFNKNIQIEPYDQYVSNKILLNNKYSQDTGFTPTSWEVMMAELANDREIIYSRK